jgi:hypothetical protein
MCGERKGNKEGRNRSHEKLLHWKMREAYRRDALTSTMFSR